VAWAHPTTGVTEGCAPSLLPHFFATIPGLSELLARGYVVTATDYPGLGTVGPHPYLVGVSEGRALLDSVRAVGRLPEAKAGPRFAVWGHSQGGHAVLFAGEMARSYAPELALVGVAAAAPATNLATLLKDDINSPVGRVLAAYALSSWSKIYGAPLDPMVAPATQPAFDRVVADCIENIGEAYRVSVDVRPLRIGFPLRDPSTVAPWPGLFARNMPGHARAGAPLFISQGTIDPIVRPDVTAQFVKVQRVRGETVRFVKLDHVGHHTAGKVSAPAAVAWIDDRFANKPAPNDDVIQPK
jgi:pimeloyl-ACP methyl ester carboxylesterase